MYIENYDPNKLIKPETTEPSIRRRTSLGEDLIKHMPTNQSSHKTRLKFADLVDQFLGKTVNKKVMNFS